MGTKMAVSFADIFMAKIETEIINHCTKKPLVWKRYIDDVFSLWDTSKEEVNTFIEQANSYHRTIKFTAEISDKEITFLNTRIYKAQGLKKSLSLTRALILNRLRPFNTRTLSLVTHRESRKVLSRENP